MSRPLRLRRRRRRHMIEAICVSLFAIAGALSIGGGMGWAAAHLVERIIGP